MRRVTYASEEKVVENDVQQRHVTRLCVLELQGEALTQMLSYVKQ